MNVTATLFGQMITFAILVFFINRVMWGPLTKAMADRRKRIEAGLAAAEHGKEQERLAAEHAKKVLRDARAQAVQAIAQANDRAAEIVAQAKVEAKEQAQRVLAANQAEIDRAMNQAREQLRKELATLVVDGAGRILEREIDPGRHDAFITELTARL